MNGQDGLPFLFIFGESIPKVSWMLADAARMGDSDVTNHAVEAKIKTWLRQARVRERSRSHACRRMRRLLVAEKRRSSGASILDQTTTDNSDSEPSDEQNA